MTTAPVRHPALRVVLIVVGSISLVVGIVALVVPLVPTTPFLLISAACFARSSERAYRWLLNHKWFGPPIRNYRYKGGLTRRQKQVALGTFWPAMLVSAFLAPRKIWLWLVFAAVLFGVTFYILRLKTVKDD